MFILPNNTIHLSKYLPFTLISLENWKIITITGKDSKNFLQNQLTIDIQKILNSTQYSFSAHCNANGKMYSIFKIFYYNKKFKCIIRKNLLKQEINILKKYSIFSDVNIYPSINLTMLGIAGNKANEILKKIFKKLPNIQETLIQEENVFLLYFKNPIERFLIITSLKKINKILIQLKKITFIHFNNSAQWESLHIESGIPILEKNNTLKFIPQSMNLEYLNAINFNKGCYCGQEIIAKAKFLSFNKRKMYWLFGIAKNIPQVHTEIEMQENKKWYIVGKILYVIKVYKNYFSIQTILRNIVNEKNAFRIKNDKNSKFNIKRLSYYLT